MPEELEFYDLRTRSKFFSRDYTTETSSKGMLIAKTVSPSGTKTVKLLRKA